MIQSTRIKYFDNFDPKLTRGLKGGSYVIVAVVGHDAHEVDFLQFDHAVNGIVSMSYQLADAGFQVLLKSGDLDKPNRTYAARRSEHMKLIKKGSTGNPFNDQVHDALAEDGTLTCSLLTYAYPRIHTETALRTHWTKVTGIPLSELFVNKPTVNAGPRERAIRGDRLPGLLL